MPSLNYIASANATLYCGAIPHFVDVDEKSLGIDPIKLKKYLDKICIIKNKKCLNKKTKRPIRALICLHIWVSGKNFRIKKNMSFLSHKVNRRLGRSFRKFFS